nr:transcription factor E2FC-like [Ipomoea batatas]
MAASGEDLDLDLNLTLSQVHLDSKAPRLVPSSCRPHHFARIPPPHPVTVSDFRTESPPLASAQRHSAPLGVFVPKNVTGCSEADNIKTLTIQVQKTAETANNSLLQQATFAAECRKARATKRAKYGTQGINSDPLDSLNVAGSCRYDNSLGLLTKKFIQLIQEAEDGTLDLNRSADILEIDLHRGFETTESRELQDQVYRLKAEVQHLYTEDQQLDYCIRKKLEQLRALESDLNCQKNLFLTEDDIMSLPLFRVGNFCANVPIYMYSIWFLVLKAHTVPQDQTIIAVKAPYASSVKVPDPSEDGVFPEKHYRLIVRSTTGPIDLYLLSKKDGQHEDVTVKHAMSSDSLTGNGSRDNKMGITMSSVSSDTSTQNAKKLSQIQKIMPSHASIDDDYWLCTDQVVSATELWGREDS